MLGVSSSVSTVHSSATTATRLIVSNGGSVAIHLVHDSLDIAP